MKKILVFLIMLICTYTSQAQKIKFNAGPELLKSFNHSTSYIGVGGSVQAEIWVKERLGLGINTGYINFSGKGGYDGIPNYKVNYSSIPVLAVIKYPIPLTKGLYGQDAFGYTFANDVHYVNDGKKVNGGFTYYFTLGYEFAEHFDVGVKVGRSRFDKKDNPANVNEHNVGLKLAYVF